MILLLEHLFTSFKVARSPHNGITEFKYTTTWKGANTFRHEEPQQLRCMTLRQPKKLCPSAVLPPLMDLCSARSWDVCAAGFFHLEGLLWDLSVLPHGRPGHAVVFPCKIPLRGNIRICPFYQLDFSFFSPTSPPQRWGLSPGPSECQVQAPPLRHVSDRLAFYCYEQSCHEHFWEHVFSFLYLCEHTFPFLLANIKAWNCWIIW